jgi:asparagine synthase (glutamine-hydrolysing)
MCGITGYVGFEEDGLLEAMMSAVAHRGPDDQGSFHGPNVALGHKRLSIIDVSGGHQPLENEDGSLLLVANGEIYDFQVVRAELEAKGHRFRTRSDSEVLLHLYEEHGPDCVERLNGMFAFAIWDRTNERLFIARDRLGIKPLYYIAKDGKFLFASELKSLLQWRGFEPTVDPRGVHQYLALRYVPGPGGMFREISKLPAGHTATIEKGRVQLRQYWKPELHGGPFDGTDEDYVEAFGAAFETSIRRRLVSEVPVGAYLSGGLDSSLIVAAIARQVTHPVRTFTVGFDYQHDELAVAAETARALGCRHTEIACRVSDVELLPKVVWHLDEPVGDPIVIPMYQLAREAKKEVTVILTGEGADEIFGGYLFHKALLTGHALARAVPGFVRRGLLARALAATPSSIINLAFHYPAALGRRGKQKVVDFLGLLDPEQLPDAYLHLISLFDERDTSALYTPDFRASLAGGVPHPAGWLGQDPKAPFLNRIIDLQFAHWLSDDILTKQDKMSMASAIEGRVPFLDHELVELGLRFPPRMKIRGKSTKHVVRRYAQRLLPPSITGARKMPFYNPIEKYASEPAFRELLDGTLSDRRVRDRGLFRPETVARLRDSVAGGEFIHVKQVFSLVALELWFQTFVDRRGVA